jgi:hypothetical protein
MKTAYRTTAIDYEKVDSGEEECCGAMSLVQIDHDLYWTDGAIFLPTNGDRHWYCYSCGSELMPFGGYETRYTFYKKMTGQEL